MKKIRIQDTRKIVSGSRRWRDARKAGVIGVTGDAGETAPLEELGDFVLLGTAVLEQQPSAAAQMLRSLGDDGFERIEARGPRDERERGRRREAFARDHHVGNRSPASEQCREAEADAEEQQRHRRSGGCHREFLASALWLATHLRKPPEEPQVDAYDPDARSARGEGVSQLVQDKRGEVAERARHSDRVVGARRATEDFPEVVVGEPVDQEEQHHEPARADADADAEYACQLEVRTPGHVFMLGAHSAYDVH